MARAKLNITCAIDLLDEGISFDKEAFDLVDTLLQMKFLDRSVSESCRSIALTSGPV